MAYIAEYIYTTGWYGMAHIAGNIFTGRCWMTCRQIANSCTVHSSIGFGADTLNCISLMCTIQEIDNLVFQIGWFSLQQRDFFVFYVELFICTTFPWCVRVKSWNWKCFHSARWQLLSLHWIARNILWIARNILWITRNLQNFQGFILPSRDCWPRFENAFKHTQF